MNAAPVLVLKVGEVLVGQSDIAMSITAETENYKPAFPLLGFF